MKSRIVTVIVLTLLVGCGEASHEGVPGAPPGAGDGGGGDSGGGSLIGGESPDFAFVKAQIFTPQCVRCHRDFEEYANVRLRLNQIQDAVLNNRMPPRAPLTDDLKGLLTEWIGLGAPETAAEAGE